MNEPARTLLEALLVGAVALGAGLAANAANPDGLSLTRDHFRTATPEPAPRPVPAPTARAPQAPTEALPAVPSPASTPTAAADAATAAVIDAATAAVTERLLARGLQVLTHTEAVALFQDPAYGAGAYVFVDARGDDAYRAGHVPGAVQFDRYHPERHIENVIAACAGALKVVVYCIGKDCEDSELAAQDLPVLGLDPRSIFVYVGGFTDWSAAGLPIEKGGRGGGDG